MCVCVLSHVLDLLAKTLLSPSARHVRIRQPSADKEELRTLSAISLFALNFAYRMWGFEELDASTACVTNPPKTYEILSVIRQSTDCGPFLEGEGGWGFDANSRFGFELCGLA